MKIAMVLITMSVLLLLYIFLPVSETEKNYYVFNEWKTAENITKISFIPNVSLSNNIYNDYLKSNGATNQSIAGFYVYETKNIYIDNQRIAMQPILSHEMCHQFSDVNGCKLSLDFEESVCDSYVYYTHSFKYVMGYLDSYFKKDKYTTITSQFPSHNCLEDFFKNYKTLCKSETDVKNYLLRNCEVLI